MKINKADLLDAVRKIMPGVESGRSIIEGADTLIFSGMGIHSYNDSISVSAPFETPGIEGAFNSRDFFRLIQKLPGEEIEAESTESGVEFRAGKIKARLNHIQSDLMKYLKTLELGEQEYTKLPDNFWEGITLCKIQDSSHPLRGLFIDGEKMYSTDQVRMNYFILDDEMPRFWVDPSSITELQRLGEEINFYAVTAEWVHFQSKSDLFFSVKRKMDEDYPAEKMDTYKEMLAKSTGDPEVSLPGTFAEAVDRVGVFSEDIKGFAVISITFASDKITLTASRDSGDIEEEIPLEETNKLIRPLTFMADAQFLIEASKKSPTLYFKDGDQPTCVFESGAFTQLLCTIKED